MSALVGEACAECDERTLVFHGTVIYSTSPSELAVLRSAVLGVENGRVAFLEEGHTEPLGAATTLRLRSGRRIELGTAELIVLPSAGFLAPGLIDTHTHAPQFPNAGTGYDLQLLQWLEKYTFPFEAKFAQRAHARAVYPRVVRRTLSLGTTTAVYFGTIHADATLELASAAAAAGQRSFVGKVCMDRHAPPYYVEPAADASLAETKRFICALSSCDGLDARARAAVAAGAPAPVAVVTPRFVPTCSAELLRGLGALATTHGVPVQSHISENTAEVQWVAELCPGAASYAGVYDGCQLLTPRTILAHGCHLTDPELALLAERRCTISHCPMSNCQLRSGMMGVRRALAAGVNVALGTDVSGGASACMLSAIREALKVSNLLSLSAAAASSPADCLGAGEPPAPLSHAEAFHLATARGAAALGVEGLTGTLAVGSFFDALVVDPNAAGSPIDLYGDEVVEDVFHKWLHLGDDRNLAAVYVAGRKVVWT